MGEGCLSCKEACIFVLECRCNSVIRTFLRARVETAFASDVFEEFIVWGGFGNA